MHHRGDNLAPNNANARRSKPSNETFAPSWRPPRARQNDGRRGQTSNAPSWHQPRERHGASPHVARDHCHTRAIVARTAQTTRRISTCGPRPLPHTRHRGANRTNDKARPRRAPRPLPHTRHRGANSTHHTAQPTHDYRTMLTHVPSWHQPRERQCKSHTFFTCQCARIIFNTNFQDKHGRLQIACDR